MTIEKSIYISILILLAISFSCASRQPLQTPNVAGDNIVSYKFVLQWPNSICSNLTAPRRCRSNVPQDFTIHGFWGFDKDDKIVNCATGYELSRYDDLQGRLRRELNENWPSHVDGEDNFRLWRRQWWKHGRCLGLEPWDYFRTAIYLKEQIEILLDRRNLVQFFIHEGLPPNNHQTYNPQRFPTRIYTKIGCATQINCNMNSNGEVLQLYEVRFCISRGWDLIDCPYDRFNQFQVSNFRGYGFDSILFPDVPAPPPPPPPPPTSRSPPRTRPPPHGKKGSPPLPPNSPIPALPPASIAPTQPSPFRRSFAEVLNSGVPRRMLLTAPKPRGAPTGLPGPTSILPPPPTPVSLTYLQPPPVLLDRHSSTTPTSFGQDSISLVGTYLQTAILIHPCTPTCSTSQLSSTLRYMRRYLKMASRICGKFHKAFSALLRIACILVSNYLL